RPSAYATKVVRTPMRYGRTSKGCGDMRRQMRLLPTVSASVTTQAYFAPTFTSVQEAAHAHCEIAARPARRSNKRLRSRSRSSSTLTQVSCHPKKPSPSSHRDSSLLVSPSGVEAGRREGAEEM